MTYLCQIKRPSSSFTDFPCTDDTVVGEQIVFVLIWMFICISTVCLFLYL